MAILYSLISRQEVVLCEYTDVSGNFPTITRVVLKKISTPNSSTNANDTTNRCTFNYDNYKFHFLRTEMLIFLCMADGDVKTSVAFALLEEMKHLFLQRFNDSGKTAIAYAMQEFSPTLKCLMEKYATTKVVDQFDEVHGKMKSVKMVMIENVNKILERGEKLDLLVHKTSNLQQDAFKFEKKATQLKNVFWWKSLKMTFILGFVGIVLLWLLISTACGFDFSKCLPNNNRQQ